MVQRSTRGVVFMMISAFFIALLSLCVKLGVNQLSVAQITFYRYFVPLVLTLPYFLWKGVKAPSRIKLHFLRSLCAVGAQWSFTYYLTRASLVDATLLWCIGPLYIPFLIWGFYRHKTPVITWVSLAVSFLGIGLIIKPTVGVFDPFSLWGLFAGLCMAFSQILFGKSSQSSRVEENLFYFFLFGTGLSAIPFLTRESGQWNFPSPNHPIFWTILTLGIASIGNQFFRSKAYQLTKPELLTPILYISVLGSGFFDWVVFHHTPDGWSIVGFLVVVGSTFLVFNKKN